MEFVVAKVVNKLDGRVQVSMHWGTFRAEAPPVSSANGAVEQYGKTFIAALEALRHPKASFSASG
jgi:hypothetical protein